MNKTTAITAKTAASKTLSKAPTARRKAHKSAILYSGPSLIDGSPIVAIAIIRSGNSKTGNMIQTHIIRGDISPLEASKTGQDYSICGDCKHRGTRTDNPLKKQAEGRSCYVNLGQGPSQVFKAYKKGNYKPTTQQERQEIGRGRMIRLGTYGDPAAVPQSIWQDVLHASEGHTGYTHQHGSKTNPANPDIYKKLMHSADTQQEALEAHAKGYRTFRVIPLKQWQDEGKASLLKNEISCPASKEAGARVQCKECKLCAGSDTKGKNIAIVDHGPQRKKAGKVSAQAPSKTPSKAPSKAPSNITAKG